MMSAVRSHGNRTTEKRFRALLIQAGLRGWQVQPPGIKGAPDFAFVRARLAIFVDGAFWHGCPSFGRFPKSRIAFWQEKIQRNVKRDTAVNRALRRAGWSVLRFWDYELAADSAAVLSRVKKRLAERQRNLSSSEKAD
jgi:DNA mismatch endonuclease (patch repair protein)